MVFTVIIPNATIIIPSPIITKFRLNRKQRTHTKPTNHKLTTALTTVLNHTSRYTVMYTHGDILTYNHQMHLYLRHFNSHLVIKLGDDNIVTVSYHGLVNIAQEYKVNALYTPTFRLCLLSINQLDTATYTSTFGLGQ
jgi:hypothetical protein